MMFSHGKRPVRNYCKVSGDTGLLGHLLKHMVGGGLRGLDHAIDIMRVAPTVLQRWGGGNSFCKPGQETPSRCNWSS